MGLKPTPDFHHPFLSFATHFLVLYILTFLPLKYIQFFLQEFLYYFNKGFINITWMLLYL
jgi:hypothetical protein